MTFCSVIIPTIGRSTLSRAVSSVLDQAIEPSEVEVVVVNDSGGPLEDMGWFVEGRTRVVATQRRERSVARNAGAAVARGRYLSFLDDDDWLLPGALATLRTLAQDSGEAAWLYGGIRVIDGTGRILGEANSGLSGNVLAHVLGGAWAPLQSSLIRADRFFQAGGFDPFICGTEDLDLCRRIALTGEFANTPAIVACLFRGSTWQTSTDYGRAADDTRRSRDGILDEPGAFARAMNSAKASHDSAYWFGRLSRACFSTVPFNLRRKRFSAAASRAFATVAMGAVAGRRTFSSRYWEGVRAHHVPGSLHFIQERVPSPVALPDGRRGRCQALVRVPEGSPLVSVIVPVHATAPVFLCEAIDSVRAQSESRWELVVVLDGATEECARLAREAEAVDPTRIRVVGHQGGAPAGLSAARNRGIANSRGDFIALLDADDVLLPRKFAEQIELLEAHPDAAMLYGRTVYWHSWAAAAGERRPDYIPTLGVPAGAVAPAPLLVAPFLDGRASVPCPCSVLVRRSAVLAVGGFNEEFKDLYEDQVFLARICLRFPVLVADTVWDRYRQHSGSMTALADRSRERLARRRFLRWLEGEAHVTGRAAAELQRAIEHEHWKLDHPALARCLRIGRRVRRLLKT